MERKRAKRTYLGFSLLFVLLAVFLIWNLLAGSVSLSASEIWQILLGGGEDLTQRRIIMQIRLPRMMAALILGGALSVSGYLLQTKLNMFTDYAAEDRRREAEAASLAREKKRQRAVLEIRKKFGKNAVVRGMDLLEGATARDRNRQIGGHKA